MAQMSKENNNQTSQPAVRKLPPRPLPPRPPMRPAPNAATPVQKTTAPVQKTVTPVKTDAPKPATTKTTQVEDKNLKVVETALSVEELNERKRRRIRNGTYALLAITLILIAALVLVIFWPVKNSANAEYNYSLGQVPGKVTVEHVIKVEEDNRFIVTFKEPITIDLPIDETHLAAIVIKPTFKANGQDITNKICLQMIYDNAEDVFNLNNSGTVIAGSNQIYIDLATNEYIYFTNIVAGPDRAYPLIAGFSASDLDEEITMEIEIYGLNAETLQLINNEYVRFNSETQIPATQEWVDQIQTNVALKKN